jgi:PAS domain S-box-containing protein
MPNTETPSETKATRCPVSGLPIMRRAEWTDLAFSDNYRFSTALIGDRIIYNQPVGNATAETLRKALDLTDTVCEALIPGDQTYVHLSDYSQVRSASPGGRKYFIDYMLAKTRLAGFIIFSASPLMRIVIKLGLKLGRTREIPVFVERTYTEAMKKALALLGAPRPAFNGDRPDRMADLYQESPHPVRQRFERGRLVLSAPHWHIKGDRFWAQNEVIDHQILHARIGGHMQAEDCDRIEALRHSIRSEIGLEKGLPVIIADVSALQHYSRRTRQRYLQMLKAWHEQHPIELYIFCGASRMVKAAAALALPFMPVKLRLADSLAESLQLVERERRQPSQGGRLSRLLRKPATRRRQEIEAYRDQLLQYLGDIDWERDGLPKPPPKASSHIMGPVFEAIALLKAELDETFAERNAIADALTKSQERFNEVMAHSRDLLFKRDIATGAFEYVSAAALELTGYEPDEIKAMGAEGVLTLIHPEDRERYLHFSKRLLNSDDDLPQDHVIEYRLRHKKGHYVWFSDSHAILRDEAGAPVQIIGNNRDIQRNKAMADERLRMAKRLQQAGKLEAVSTLAGGIAHNYNNLLMTILGNVEMTRMQLAADSKLTPRIDAIQKAADRAAELSTLMLTYVGQSKLSFDILELGNLVGEMARVLKASMSQSDQLYLVEPESETHISGDPGKIGQVITDVVTNAMEATADDDRRITIRTGSGHFDAAYFEGCVAYEPLPPGDYTYFEVEDNGIGMNAQTLEKVFDPFFTTKFTGRGLGLAAAVGIIRAHQGTIAFTSRPDRGTTVTVLFPSVPAPAARSRAPRETPIPRRDTCNAVLLVDDEPMVIEVGEMMLEAIGFDIVTAKDGIEALEQLKRHRAEIALIILDLTMPRMDGFEAFHEITRTTPEIPIIIASGYTRGQVRQQFREHEPAAYLKKPFRVDQLADTIRQVLPT